MRGIHRWPMDFLYKGPPDATHASRSWTHFAVYEIIIEIWRIFFPMLKLQNLVHTHVYWIIHKTVMYSSCVFLYVQTTHYHFARLKLFPTKWSQCSEKAGALCVYNPFPGCWCPADVRSQGISKNGVDDAHFVAAATPIGHCWSYFIGTLSPFFVIATLWKAGTRRWNLWIWSSSGLQRLD